MQNYKWRNIMKKQTILAFTTALGIAMSVSAPVEAASANRVNISVYEKDCTTNQWNSVETGSINDVLKKYVIVFRQSFYRKTAYRKFQKTTKKSRHRIHQKNLIRQRNQTHRKSRVHQKGRKKVSRAVLNQVETVLQTVNSRKMM